MATKALEEWSDSEIRSALLQLGEKDVPPITPATKPSLLRKLSHILHHEPAKQRESEETYSGAIGKHEHGNCSPQSTVEGYYGVVTSLGDHGRVQIPIIYTSKAATMEAIKNLPGARFKKFESQHEAELFSQQGSFRTVAQEVQAAPVSERANNYPKVKVQDLSKLRGLIECEDVADFASTVWGNPRYLITSGDTPEILQEGCRYNALHCAVRAKRLDMCKELMSILSVDSFWELVYPDDSAATREERKSHLIDLYLNGQDKINNETPLHFASKLGLGDIVAFLMAFPTVSTTVVNRYGETPFNIACLNARDAPLGLKEKIQASLSAPEIYYVPVLRSVDNCTPPMLGKPCTLESHWQGSPLADNTGTPIKGQAFAGPMSPSEADEFYREWRSPSCQEQKIASSNIKRSDYSKGLERVGRQIAHKWEVRWTEYWDFLCCYSDLSTADGLQQLEEYLASHGPSVPGRRSLFSPTEEGSSEDSVQRRLFSSGENDLLPSDDTEDCHARRTVDSVCTSLFELKLDGATNEGTDSPQGTNPPAAESSSGFLSYKAVDTGSSLEPHRTPRRIRHFLTGDTPTKVDYDVQLAIPEVDVDILKFPHVHQWLQLVNSYPERERSSWRTPVRTVMSRGSRLGRSHLVSPLVVSSPLSSPSLLPSRH